MLPRLFLTILPVYSPNIQIEGNGHFRLIYEIEQEVEKDGNDGEYAPNISNNTKHQDNDFHKVESPSGSSEDRKVVFENDVTSNCEQLPDDYGCKVTANGSEIETIVPDLLIPYEDSESFDENEDQSVHTIMEATSECDDTTLSIQFHHDSESNHNEKIDECQERNKKEHKREVFETKDLELSVPLNAKILEEAEHAESFDANEEEPVDISMSMPTENIETFDDCVNCNRGTHRRDVFVVENLEIEEVSMENVAYDGGSEGEQLHDDYGLTESRVEIHHSKDQSDLLNGNILEKDEISESFDTNEKEIVDVPMMMSTENNGIIRFLNISDSDTSVAVEHSDIKVLAEPLERRNEIYGAENVDLEESSSKIDRDGNMQRCEISYEEDADDQDADEEEKEEYITSDSDFDDSDDDEESEDGSEEEPPTTSQETASKTADYMGNTDLQLKSENTAKDDEDEDHLDVEEEYITSDSDFDDSDEDDNAESRVYQLEMNWKVESKDNLEDHFSDVSSESLEDCEVNDVETIVESDEEEDSDSEINDSGSYSGLENFEFPVQFDTNESVTSHFATVIETLNSIDFESRSQEEAAKVILLLSEAAGINPTVWNEAVDVAETIVTRVEAVRRNPIPASTQLINNIVAQCPGSGVRAETNWNINVNPFLIGCLLRELMARGHFKLERDLIYRFF